MDSTSKGSSWAGNMYQKWENICLENIIAQNQCKYADALGEQFRMMLDEIANDWLNHSDGWVEGPVSDLSLEHDVIAEVCNKARQGLVEYHLNEKLPHCVELKPYVSSVKSLTDDALGDECEDSGHGKRNLVSILSEDRSKNSDDKAENCKDVLEPVRSSANCITALPSPNEAISPISHQNEVMEGELMLSGKSAREGSVSHFGSQQKDHEQQNELSISEDSEWLLNPENLEEPNIRGVLEPNTDLLEEFEDIKLEDCRENTENYEVNLTTVQSHKKMSYKKKLGYAFRSKPQPPKPGEPAQKLCAGINTGIQNRQGMVASSVSTEVVCPKISSSQECCEYDWEFL